MTNMKQRMNLIQNRRNIDKVTIDKEVKSWTEVVKKRIDEDTPQKANQYIPHPKDSDYLKLLQGLYIQIKNNMLNQENRILRRNIQEAIKTENLRLFDENWNNIIKKTELHKKDPQKFWESMRRLMGEKANGPPAYAWNNNKEKIYDEQEKLEIFKTTWENKIFQITAEENEEFDRDNERVVSEFLEENNYRTKPYDKANLNRLDNNNPLTRPITEFDIIKILRNFKNKAPRESGLTRNMIL